MSLYAFLRNFVPAKIFRYTVFTDVTNNHTKPFI